MKKLFSLFIIIIIISIINSCTNEGNQNTKNSFDKTSKSIEIKNSWMTPAAKNRNSAVYFKIINNTDITDTLYEVTSTISQVTELHQTYKIRNDMLGMKSVDSVIIAANSTFEFSPSGYHVMLIGLINNLPIDSKGEITLKFKVAGTFTTSAVCKVSEN